mmetsp:Transcript_17299/g.40145  ORF Transcript_17299/g.40145 Transcript_17299/m.40145 type:complete len:203 (+) Transcript_17299:1180-1788(+)
MDIPNEVQDLGHGNMVIAILLPFNLESFIEVSKSFIQFALLLMYLSHVLKGQDNIMMILTKSLALHSQGFPVVAHRLIIFSDLQEDCSDVVPKNCNVTVVRSKELSSDSETLHETLLCHLEHFLLEQYQPNRVQRGCDIGIVLSQVISTDAKRVLIKIKGRPEILHLVLHQSHAAQCRGNVNVVGSVCPHLHKVDFTVLFDG